MEYIGEIAFYKNRRDEIPNQQLAASLAEKEDIKGIEEIAGYLRDRNKSIQSDCLKVLYEIGYLKPQLIRSFADEFLYHLNSRNNRMVWGSMIALANIAALEHEKIFQRIELILDKIANGSLITHVWGIYVLINLCKAGENYRSELFPLLLQYCRECRPVDFAKRIESLLEIVKPEELPLVRKIVEEKKDSLSDAQCKRAVRALKRFEQS